MPVVVLDVLGHLSLLLARLATGTDEKELFAPDDVTIIELLSSYQLGVKRP